MITNFKTILWCIFVIAVVAVCLGCQGAAIERLELRAESIEQSLVTLQVGGVGRDKIQNDGWTAYLAVGALAIAALSPFIIVFYMVAHRFRALRGLFDWMKGKT